MSSLPMPSIACMTRPAVERLELEAVKNEGHPHRGAGRLRGALAIAREAEDAGVGEDRYVELGGLLGLVVEPQERADRLHRGYLHRSRGRESAQRKERAPRAPRGGSSCAHAYGPIRSPRARASGSMPG